MEDNVTLYAFEEMLKGHDWYYDRSDDRRSYERGYNAHQEIIRISKTSLEHQKLYETYKAKIK